MEDGRPETVAKPSAIGRVAGAFFSPVATFQSIAARPTWLPPLLLWTVVSLAVTVVVLPRMDFEKMFRERMERSGQTMTDERMQQIIARQKSVGTVVGYGIAAASPAILTLLIAVIFWGAFKAFGWDATYRQAFGATAHAFLPGVLGALLLLPVLASRESVDPRGMGDLLRSNLGFLVDPSSKALHALLQSFDLFSLWSLVLFVIGFSAAARVSRGKAAGIVVPLWALYVLGKTGWAAVFS